MRTSIPYLALILWLTSPITAFTSLKVPTRITAGTQIEIEITNDLSSPSSSDAKTDAFRIYLWHNGNMCYLIRQSPITVSKLNIVIPPSVGPNDYYILVAMQITLPPHEFTQPIFTDSARFNLTGATGNWSAFETSLVSHRPLADADRLDCGGMECARGCVKDFEGENPRAMDDRRHYECLARCPGADYPSWEEYKGLPPSNFTQAFSKLATEIVTSTPSSISSTSSSSSSSSSSTSSTQSTIRTLTNSTTEPSLTPPPPPVATSTPAPEPSKSEGMSFGVSMEVSTLMFICLAVHFGVWA